MAAKVRRLRPKAHDRIAEALQLVLELPLGTAARSELTDTLSSYAPEPWPYVMLSRLQARQILRRISAGERPGVTATVWMAALSYAVHGSGEIAATRQELAELAGTSEREVSRALSRLVELGALLRTGRGRYMVHPAAAWSGPLTSREAAERKLTPVE
jgi:DNA-binding transcriptional ArsR family regulator